MIARRLGALILSILAVIQLSVGISAASPAKVDVSNLTFVPSVESHLASPSEKSEALETLQSSRNAMNLNPENYVVEKRAPGIFITYSAANLGANSAELELVSIDTVANRILEQQRYIFTRDERSNDVTAELVSNGKPVSLANGDLSSQRTPTITAMKSLGYGTAKDACERSVSSLCAVGTGVGAAIACGILGLTVIAGAVCAGVAALISQLGCDGAKERVCADARD